MTGAHRELNADPAQRERVLYLQPTGPNPLHHSDDFSRPALRHGSLNFLFQVASYLPSKPGLALLSLASMIALGRRGRSR